MCPQVLPGSLVGPLLSFAHRRCLTPGVVAGGTWGAAAYPPSATPPIGLENMASYSNQFSQDSFSGMVSIGGRDSISAGASQGPSIQPHYLCNGREWGPQTLSPPLSPFSLSDPLLSKG